MAFTRLPTYPVPMAFYLALGSPTCFLAGSSLDLRGASQNQPGDRKSSGLVIVMFCFFQYSIEIR